MKTNAQEKAFSFIKDDIGIYVENPSASDTLQDRYTRDNKIYTVNREFTYDYYILKGNQKLKIIAPSNVGPNDDFQRAWDFIDPASVDPDKIATISFKVLPGVTNTSQTKVNYIYYCNNGFTPCQFSATSGFIENKMNVWAHPHRDKYFMILELNPFPYIQQPYLIGAKWKWNLEIGDHWGDKRWKTWTGSIQNNYDYEITGKEILATKLGKMDCWVVRANAVSSIGHTSLLAYFNETNGFVKFDFTNIDGSHLVMEIERIY